MNEDIETRFRMVKEWLSAEEIRALDLPGMPKSKSSMMQWLKKRRDAGHVPAEQLRHMKGHNRGWEYHRDFISAELRSGELFFSAAELAEMNLPSMPTTSAGIKAMILRRRREGIIPAEYLQRSFKSGGGMIYHYKCLPAKAARAFELGLGEKPRPRISKPLITLGQQAFDSPLPPVNVDYRPSEDAVRAATPPVAPASASSLIAAAEGGRLEAFAEGILSARPETKPDELRERCIEKFGKRVTIPMPSALAFAKLVRQHGRATPDNPTPVS